MAEAFDLQQMGLPPKTPPPLLVDWQWLGAVKEQTKLQFILLYTTVFKFKNELSISSKILYNLQNLSKRNAKIT